MRLSIIILGSCLRLFIASSFITHFPNGLLFSLPPNFLSERERKSAASIGPSTQLPFSSQNPILIPPFLYSLTHPNTTFIKPIIFYSAILCILFNNQYQKKSKQKKKNQISAEYLLTNEKRKDSSLLRVVHLSSCVDDCVYSVYDPHLPRILISSSELHMQLQ